MKRFKNLIAGTLVAAFGVFGVATLAPATPALAVDPLAICDDPANADNAVCQNRTEDASSLIGLLVNTLLFLIGVISAIMIIWAGITYTTSAGDASRVKRAKDTLMYAVVGLVVAFLAFAIVNWVLDLF